MDRSEAADTHRPDSRVRQLVSAGLRNPRAIPQWLLERVYPRKFSPWVNENGVITWNTDRGFDWAEGETRSQVEAITYHLVQAIREDLDDRQFDHALDVGCGYGRTAPWLTEHAGRVTGVDPNEQALAHLEIHFPDADIETVAASAQALPFPDDDADLVFTLAVLQHVPPKEIVAAAGELKRVATGDAVLLLCEATDGEETGPFYVRSAAEYARLFEPFALERSWEPPAPATTRDYTRRHLLFSRD